MATKRIRCGSCGFGAILSTAGESPKLIVDSAKQIQICSRHPHRPQTNGRRLDPLDCPDFRDAVQGPTITSTPGTTTLLREAESEGLGIEQVAAQNAAYKKPARVRRSRKAEAPKSEVASPKAKSARPSPTKRPRSVPSDIASVAEGESMVS